ncbi:MAG TPA: type IV toxin-antitoxin system AbiEi family antitoxin [Dysgonamonadaceae bacterium]|nr:type IV toxin-antitoxin system AbiEi family antitoxin [Dysgonamonadaceae bacterium]
MTVAKYINQLLSYEEYSFSLNELVENISKSETSIKSELNRLVAKKEVINLRKGFYLIIPPRYSVAQRLPIQLYIEKLFNYLDRNYYVALLSAAKFHGASHQQIQRDYIITETPKFKDISKNTIDIHFFTTSNWTGKNIEIKKSDAGLYKLSSPALTIVDIINYQTKLGGINRILSIIEELSEELQGSDLVELINWYPHRSVLQRVGFLLQKLRVNEECQELLFKNLKTSNFFPVLLTPKLNERPGAVNNRWKVDINVKIESDL